MDISKMGLHFLYGLTVEGDDQVQYTVCGRVLGTDVDHHVSLFIDADLFCSAVHTGITV
jgi:hypothetical protein